MEALRIISEEHRNLWRIASTLDSVAEEMAAGQPVESAFSAIFDYIEEFMDGCHHAKEDEYLFPACASAVPRPQRCWIVYRPNTVTARNSQSLTYPIGGGRRLGKRGLPCCPAHLHAKPAQPYPYRGKDCIPLAREVLLPEDWRDIDRAFLDNNDPLFGESARAEYRELFHRIANLAPESVGLGAHSTGELQQRNTAKHSVMVRHCCRYRGWKAATVASRRSRA